MANYQLAESWGKHNTQGRIYYCQNAAALTELKENEKIQPGDCAYVITAKKIYMCDFNDTWQEV